MIALYSPRVENGVCCRVGKREDGFPQSKPLFQFRGIIEDMLSNFNDVQMKVLIKCLIEKSN